MDAAANAINSLLGKSGKNDTTVDEQTAAPVQHETVVKKHQEQVQNVVEKERHKDHYHTTVQPLTDNEVKPEVHTHKQAPTQHREFEHDDKAKTQHKLAADKAQFKDTTTQGPTIQTKSQAPTVSGEHVHHHIHETVQPVIQKETVQPSVTHTTIPIKETHHEAAEHHASTIAQPMSINEFKKDNSLTGTSAAHKTKYEGTPKGEAN